MISPDPTRQNATNIHRMLESRPTLSRKQSPTFNITSAFRFIVIVGCCGIGLVESMLICSRVEAQPQPQFTAARASANVARPKQEQRPLADNLPYWVAKRRVEQVSDVAYQIEFTFNESSEFYSGRINIDFNFNQTESDLDLDYHGKRIKQIILNGQPLHVKFNGEYITLPKERLQRKNKVKVDFEAEFDGSELGLKRYQDTHDNSTYIYSNLEPYSAHHLFPCFDQPSIKAKFLLTVSGPAAWSTISNSLVVAEQLSADGHTRTTRFRETLPFSTYVFSLYTGPFVVWRDKTATVPIALYARASQKQEVDAENFLTMLREGVRFFGNYFAYPYPFDKLDMVIVPELDGTAMENVAAIAIKEELVLIKSTYTKLKDAQRHSTVLHEISHMWFGNLTTMAWWDGLWLNESFATYMAAVAMTEVFKSTDYWMHFGYSIKKKSYWEDDAETTHAVDSPVEDTQKALSYFDGITYGKGASTIRQLVAMIGPEAFKAGVRSYIKKYALSNSTREDFIAALQQNTTIDLSRWSQQWLTTEGLNNAVPRWACKDKKITKFEIIQGVSSGKKILRRHHTQIGLIERSGNELLVAELMAANYEGAQTQISGLLGHPCPTGVFINVKDEDFVKAYLDEPSLMAFKLHIADIKDDFLRSQILTSLWFSLTDGKLLPIDYLAAVRAALRHEGNDIVIKAQLERLSYVLWHYLPVAIRTQVNTELEKFLHERMMEAQSAGVKRLYAEALIELTRSVAGLKWLADWRAGKLHVADLVLDQELRWKIVETLSATGQKDCQPMIQEEKQRDVSDASRKHEATILAARPDLANKEITWQRLIANSTDGSLRKAEMVGFNYPGQEELLRPYAEKFYQVVLAIYQQRDDDSAKNFTTKLLPTLSERSIAELGRAFLKANDAAVPQTLRLAVRNRCQEIERAVRIRELAGTKH